MAPIDRSKLRSHLDFVRGNVRKLEQLRDRTQPRTCVPAPSTHG